MWWEGGHKPTTNEARNSDLEDFWAASKGNAAGAIKHVTGTVSQALLAAGATSSVQEKDGFKLELVTSYHTPYKPDTACHAMITSNSTATANMHLHAISSRYILGQALHTDGGCNPVG